MMRPAATDIVGTLAYLTEAIDDLRRTRDEARYSPTEAARALGFNQSHFWGKPWRIPTFGLQYDREYTLPEYRAWLERPEAERRAEWDQLPLKARRNAQGAA